MRQSSNTPGAEQPERYRAKAAPHLILCELKLEGLNALFCFEKDLVLAFT